MRLPTSNHLRNFNYVLAVIANLSVDGWCTIKAVNDTCAQKTFNAEIIDYRKIIELLEYCGLVSKNKGKISMTSKGVDFMALNSEAFVELSTKQKQFLAQHSIFYGVYKTQAKQIFDSFVSDHVEVTYKYTWPENSDISINHKTAIHIFEHLGIIARYGDVYAVEPHFVKHVKQIRSEKKGITQEELELNLDANRNQGFRAEELIVQYEQTRLKQLGLYAEADRVRRISVLEPLAGYDIRSFTGKGPAIQYDKFIEVKSSQKSSFEFYWSKNEIDIAKEMGDAYWVYFVPDFADTTLVDDIAPLAIQNPAETILNNSAFECEPRLFKVTESGDRKYKKLDDEIRKKLTN